MSEAPQDPYVAGTISLRDTAKWMVGGIIGAAVGVLAGSPLTGLGGLEIGDRLWIAVGSASAAFLLLGVLFWQALTVIAADTISVGELAEPNWRARRAAKAIQKHMRGQLPGGHATFVALYRAAEATVADASDEPHAAMTRMLSAFKPRLGFEYRRYRFFLLRGWIAVLMPFVVIGVGIFAWAANPPDTKSPAACDIVERGAVVTVQTTPAGLELSKQPPGASCRPIQLILQKSTQTYITK